MHILQEKILNLAKNSSLKSLGLRKLAKLIEIEHPQRVKYHLEQLEKNGFIRLNKEKNRIIGVIKHNENSLPNTIELFNIPVLGNANCGQPLEFAEEDIQGYVKLSPKSVGRTNPKGLFAIQAVGDSLNRANIDGRSVENGDFVVIDGNQRQPENGKYILSIIDGACNLKKFYKDGQNNEIRLVSESTLNIPPIILHEDDISTSGYIVNGVVVKVIKN